MIEVQNYQLFRIYTFNDIEKKLYASNDFHLINSTYCVYYYPV